MKLRLIAIIFNFFIYSAFFLSIFIVYIYTDISRSLPEYKDLIERQSPSLTRYFSDDGFVIHEEYDQYRLFINHKDIPDLLKKAFISAEDKNFYSHNGLDLVGIFRAAGQNLYSYIILNDENRLIGASTITQQLVKNLILNNKRTVTRKVKEIILANKIENFLSKEQILEMYLNEIYLGRGVYGVVAASEVYFNKSLEDLNIEEFAFLAALPKAPSNYDPSSNYDGIKERRDWVLDRMAENQFITKSVAQIIKTYPIVYREIINNKIDVNKDKALIAKIKEESNSKLNQATGSKGQLNYQTSINYEATQYLKSSVDNFLKSYDHGSDSQNYLDIELMLISPITGRKIIDYRHQKNKPARKTFNMRRYNNILKPLYFSGILKSDFQLNTKLLVRDQLDASSAKLMTVRDLFNNSSALPSDYLYTGNSFIREYLSSEDFLKNEIIIDDKSEININLEQIILLLMPLINNGIFHELTYIDKVTNKETDIIYKPVINKRRVMDEKLSFKIKSLLCTFDNKSVDQDKTYFLSRDCSFSSQINDDIFIMAFSSDILVGVIIRGEAYLQKDNFLEDFNEKIINPLMYLMQEEELKDYLIPDNVKLIEINKDTGNIFNVGSNGVLEFF